MSLPAHSKLDHAHGSEAGASVDLHAALPTSVSRRSVRRFNAMLFTAEVFAIAVCVMAGIALAINVAAVTVGEYRRVPFTFVNTSAIWFGILNVGVCVTALLFIRKLLKGQFSDCLTVTGILVSLFSFILACGALSTGLSILFVAFRNELITSPGPIFWLFITVVVLSFLTFFAELALSVFMVITVSMAAGCCYTCQPAHTVDVAMPPPASIVYTPSQPAQIVTAPGQTAVQSV